nr:MAG TPA: Neck appendage protein [Caudoviricetes sp.]
MIYLFDKDERLIKIIRKPAIKTALQKYSLTKERYVSDRLTVEMKALNDDELEKIEYMAIQTMEDAHTFHYFYVAQKSSDQLTTLIGVQSGIEELRKSPVFDKRPQNALAREVINDLLSGTNWQARFVGETTPHSTNFYYISIFDALKKVCEVWDLEMQFFVEMNGNRIGARYIDFKRKIGQAVGKRVVYGHNALQILQEVERTNIFTALIGRGKGEQVSSAEDSGKQANGFGRKITFEDVVWSTASGKPVNKQKGQKYVELPAMTELYGIKNADGSMRPKIGFVDFAEEENPEQLLERTYKALVNAARPRLALKTSSVYLRGAKIGDTIRVVRHDKRLDYDTRIFDITFNRLNDQSSDIELGDRIGESNEAKAQTIADKAIDEFVANEFTNFVKNLPDYLPTADGFNNNWYGAEDPTREHPGKVLINDIWYKPDPEHEGHKIMLRWTGEVWEELLRTFSSEALRAKISGEIEKLDKAMKASDLALKEQTAQALRTAGANASAIEAAKGAITKLNQDLAGAKTDLTQAQGQLSSNIAQIRSDVGIIRTQQTVYEQTNAQNMSRIVGQIDDKASKSEVKQTADRIREELAGLAVGGRNYFLNSGLEITSGYKEIQIHPDFVKHAKGKKFVISVQVLGENVVAQNRGRFGLSTSAGIVGSTNRAWSEVWETGTGNISKKRIYQVFDFKDNWIDFVAGLYVQTGNGAVTGFPKLEIGAIPTDWTPAPEDTEGLITDAKATFERTAQGLRTDLTAVQAYVSADGMRAEALRTYSRGETARQLTAERKLIEAGYVAKAQHTEDVRSISRRFEELTEGGVNLLRNSANLPTAGDYRNGKWVATSGGNGTAQIVPVTSSPSPLIKSMIRIVNNTVGNKDLSQAAMALVVGQKYTVSCYARVASDSPSPTVGLLIRSWANNNDANRKLHKTISNRDWERHSFTFTADVVANSIQFGQSGAGSVEICAPKIELGTVATSWSPSPEDATSYAETKLAEYKQNVDGQFATISQQIAGKASQTDFQRVQETSKLYERLIGSTEKEVTDKVSRMALTNELFQVEVSKNLGLRTVQYQMANAWAVQNLNSNGDIVSQINMTGPNVRIQGESIHLDGKTLIDNGIIKNAMIESMLADKITAGTLNAANVNIINLNASKIVGLDANFIKSKIEMAFIEWMKGKVISAQNDAMQIDLNNGQYNVMTDQAAVRRVLNGYPNQFLKFTSETEGGAPASVTVLGANRDGTENSKNDSFAGIRLFSGNKVERTEIISDVVRFATGAVNYRGWEIRTLYGNDNRQVILQPFGNVTRSNIVANYFNGIDLVNVLETLNQMMANLGNHTGRHDIFGPIRGVGARKYAR